MDKVFIFNLPAVAEKLAGDYEVISGTNFKEAARKASPPLTDSLAFAVIKNQDSYGFPADKWVKLAVAKLGPVLVVGSGSLAGIDGATYCGSEDEVHDALSEMGIEVSALKQSEDFSGLFFDEQAPTPGSSAGKAEQYEYPATGFELPGIDPTPETAPETGFELPGIYEQTQAPGSGEQDKTPTTTLPVTEPAPATSFDLPGVSPAPTPGFDLPGVSAGPAPAPEPSPASFELPSDAMPFSSPLPQGGLYDDIDLSLPEPEEVATPGPSAASSWGEVPDSSPAPSWEDQPAETNWRPTRGSEVSEPARPAPAPPIAPAATPHTTNGGCPTIIVFGAKGGVGKTTTSIHLAQRAGRLCPDMRVTLIDANRGQGDIRTKLRTLNVPTIFDALPEEGRGAIITPPALDKDRPPHLEPLAFALIAAPPSELSDPTQVTPEVYQNALSEARDVSDLVIVDTQISEKYDTTKLFENFLIPLLIKDENIWGVGATEDSPESINNLLERLHQYRARGVKAAKIFTLIAQAHAHNTPEDLRDFEEMFDQASSFAGAVPYNKTIYNRLSSGILCEGLPPVAEPLDRILYAVTGKNAFITRKEPEAKKKKRRPRFGRAKKRRK
ncbi:MAG: ParA family protein [Varibaculum cambriense]|uniref:ParA family protein n=1 Tax=Varibaculum cambriense TaxID=184870 RepID=UPI0029144E03|nr:ParA family protein [Varibaculum cambriense]MDU6681093.1 ParA family protein [Varibaculum cambriense]